MSTSLTPSNAEIDVAGLCAAIDLAAAALAVDGRLAGPASPQEVLDDLVPSPDALGILSEVAPGVALVVLVAPALAVSLGAPDGDQVIEQLRTVLAAAATNLGAPLGPLVSLEGPADLVAHLDGAAPDALVAAGVFDGDAVVATVGSVVFARPGGAPTAGEPFPPAAGAGTPTGNAVPAATGARGTEAFRTGDAAAVERGLQLLSDIELTVTAELGRARMAVGELLDLQPGAVIELDREAGVPIDLLVNGMLFARGEVVVVDDAFAVRLSEIVSDEGAR